MTTDPIIVAACFGVCFVLWIAIFAFAYASDSRRFARERAERVAHYQTRYPWLRKDGE